jgi:hypothetical protein
MAGGGDVLFSCANRVVVKENRKQKSRRAKEQGNKLGRTNHRRHFGLSERSSSRGVPGWRKDSGVRESPRDYTFFFMK